MALQDITRFVATSARAVARVIAPAQICEPRSDAR
jgi:hypothetical protein